MAFHTYSNVTGLCVARAATCVRLATSCGFRFNSILSFPAADGFGHSSYHRCATHSRWYILRRLDAPGSHVSLVCIGWRQTAFAGVRVLGSGFVSLRGS